MGFRNISGKKLASGVYFYGLRLDNEFSQTKEMLVLRYLGGKIIILN